MSEKTTIHDTKQIISGLESYDTVTNTNRLHMSSPSYYLAEEGKFSFPKTTYGWDYHYSIPNSIENTYIKWLSHITYMNIDEISNEKYFYIVRLNSSTFFKDNKQIGFRCVDKRTIDHVRNNQAKIVISYVEEGFHGLPEYSECFYIIQDWINEINIPSENVYFLTGDLKASINHGPSVEFNIVGVSSWDNANNPSDYKPLNFEPSGNNCLYLNLNRSRNKHRALLLTCLLKNNLLDSGLNSFNYDGVPVHMYFGEYIRDDSTLKTYADAIQQMRLRMIDIPYETQHIAGKINSDLYKSTFCSIVTESWHEKEVLFISEKTWKPILNGHPFMLVSNPGHLNYLKELGFKTFNKWFDESYDSCEDLLERIKIILSNIEKYKSCTIPELKHIRNDMRNVTEYNYEHFTKLYKNKYTFDEQEDMCPSKCVTDELLKIYNNWR